MQASWASFSAAPHRLFFFAGGCQAILAMLLWVAWLALRQAETAPSLPLPGAWLHAWLMLYGFFPFFIMGFSMTAIPNWLNAPGVEHRHYVGAFLPMAGGALLVYLGLFTTGIILIAGLALHLWGWSLGTWRVFSLVRTSRHPGKRHFYMAVAVIICGLAGEGVFIAAVARGDARLFDLARGTALWLFLLPTFFSISHRVVPLFTSWSIKGYEKYQPLWMLPVMTLCCLVHFGLEQAGMPAWLWLADTPLLAMALTLSWRWQSWRCAKDATVGLLHVGFAWLSVALALMVAQSLMAQAGSGVSLGLAPLHALVVGYFASMLIGMSARVVIAHSGAAIAMDSFLWTLFWLFQGMAMLRVLSEWPGLAAQAQALHLVTAVLWLLCWGGWGMKFLPVLVKPRPDGNPG